jgi:hypothetical protein
MADAESDAYFFLNPDAFVSTTCLEKLMSSLLQDDGLAVVSPTILHPENDKTEYAGALLDFDTLNFQVLGSRELDWKQATGTIETGRPAGAAMLVRRTSLEKVGPMEESYFLYWEECEWASRFHKSGMKVGYIPEAVVFHTANHSTGGVGSKIYEYYFTRNVLRLVEVSRGSTKTSTLLKLLPLLIRRLRDFAHQRKYASLVTALRYDILGVMDFLRGRSGHRAGLPSIRVRRTASE